jgi:nucleotidyltransferase substrate binding protein (TIGR01987 family)
MTNPESDMDVRWMRRHNNYRKALSQLDRFIARETLNDLEEMGFIQAFEYTYELAWNVLKDYLEMQGETAIHGSRDTFRIAFRRGLIADGETWMDMIRSRALTTHTYEESVAREIARDIRHRYHTCFLALDATMSTLRP